MQYSCQDHYRTFWIMELWIYCWVNYSQNSVTWKTFNLIFCRSVIQLVLMCCFRISWMHEGASRDSHHWNLIGGRICFQEQSLGGFSSMHMVGWSPTLLRGHFPLTACFIKVNKPRNKAGMKGTSKITNEESNLQGPTLFCGFIFIRSTRSNTLRGRGNHRRSQYQEIV